MLRRGAVLIALAALLATTPAFAQYASFWVEPSYSGPDGNGNLWVDAIFGYWSMLGGTQTSGDIDLGTYVIPGAVVPAYTDCSGNQQSGGPVAGSGTLYIDDYWLHNETEWDPNEYWVVDLDLDMYSAGVTNSACQSGSCSAGTDYSVFYEYYGDVDFEVDIGD
jgi:hypothetical protein